VTERSTDAIVTSITTTDDNNVLVFSREVGVVGELGVQKGLGVLVEELHGKVNTLELTALDGKITSNGGTGGNDDGIVAFSEVVERRMTLLADSNTSLEVNTLGGHEVSSALDNALIKLHVGDAVHEQTTKTVGTLIEGNEVTSMVELVSAGQAGGTRSNNGNSLASADLRRAGNHPAHLEATVDNGTLNRLDANGVLVDAQNASALARSGADTTSELGEVVGHEQTVESVLPLVVKNQFVPLGDNVGDGATSLGLTEGNTTVHATGRLVLELILIETRAKLSPILETGGDRAVLLSTTLVLHEALSLVENQGTLLLSGVVANSFFKVQELGSLLGLLGVNRNSGKVVLGAFGLGSLGGLFFKDTLVVDRKDPEEARQSSVEVHQDASSTLGSSVVVVVFNETAEEGNLTGLLDRANLDHLHVDLRLEVTIDIQDVGNSARHTSREVATSSSENDNATASHVLAAVVTNALNDGRSTGVSDSKPLGGDTAEEAATGSSTVQADVSNKDVLLCLEHGRARGVDDQATTRQTLTDVIVGIALKLQSDTRSQESTKRLTGRALDINVNSVQGKAFLAVSLRDVV
jgi:hypothetical protein